MKFTLRRLTPLLTSLLNHLRLPSQENPSIIIFGLRSSLHTLGSDSKENTVSIVTVQQYFDCCFRIRYRRNIFTESLPYNERLLWLRYSGFQALCHNILCILKTLFKKLIYMFRSVNCNVYYYFHLIEYAHYNVIIF
jgi:hypothetical protein